MGRWAGGQVGRWAGVGWANGLGEWGELGELGRPASRPVRGSPLFWPLGTGTPQRAKKKAAMAPNLNQRRGWPGRMTEGPWEPRGPWVKPN